MICCGRALRRGLHVLLPGVCSEQLAVNSSAYVIIFVTMYVSVRFFLVEGLCGCVWVGECVRVCGCGCVCVRVTVCALQYPDLHYLYMYIYMLLYLSVMYMCSYMYSVVSLSSSRCYSCSTSCSSCATVAGETTRLAVCAVRVHTSVNVQEWYSAVTVYLHASLVQSLACRRGLLSYFA